MPFDREINLFIEYIVVERGLARRTAASYRSDLRTAAEFFDSLGRASWAEVSREDILDYLENRRIDGMESTTVARNLISLKMLMRYLCDEKLLARDVTAVMDGPHCGAFYPICFPKTRWTV